MAKTRHPCVYLDLSHLSPKLVDERFPHIRKVCAEFGLDFSHDLIPVRPGAHYMIGGLTIDQNGRTSVPGLWAAGEVTSSGLHGANRLGSNSLLEGLVFGLRAGSGASQVAADQPDTFTAIPLRSDWPERPQDDGLDLEDVRNSLTSLMSRNVGIERDAEGFEIGRRTGQFLGWLRLRPRICRSARLGAAKHAAGARLVIASAAARTESRGFTTGATFPGTDQEQAEHIAIAAT